MTVPLQVRDFAVDFDRAVRVEELVEEGTVILKAADRRGKQPVQPARILRLGLGQVPHAPLKVLAAGIDRAEYDLVPQDEIQINLISRDLDFAAPARDARKDHDAVLAGMLRIGPGNGK
jgi:hypothetical protein